MHKICIAQEWLDGMQAYTSIQPFKDPLCQLKSQRSKSTAAATFCWREAHGELHTQHALQLQLCALISLCDLVLHELPAWRHWVTLRSLKRINPISVAVGQPVVQSPRTHAIVTR